MTDVATRKGGILYLHALTSVHAGCGSAVGLVDLPIQRERHTQWPTIPGSSLKGILRDACRETIRDKYPADEKGSRKRSQRTVANEDDPDLAAVFGPGKIDEKTSHAGALAVTDARVLAFPVRSLKGVFAWATCRDALLRYQRDCAVAGLSVQGNAEATGKGALCAPNSPLLVNGSKIVLEEFDFDASPADSPVSRWLAEAVDDESTKQRILRNWVVISNDRFTYFVKHATEVAARIAMNYETKTVSQGALFYQEFLPPETLLYSILLAGSSRSGSPKSPEEVLGYVKERLPKYLQVGGDETTGKGICSVKIK